MLHESMTLLRAYLRTLDEYGILDKGYTVLSEPSDPARRREAKIAAFKAEREVKSNIEVRTAQHPASDVFRVSSLSPRSDQTMTRGRGISG